MTDCQCPSHVAKRRDAEIIAALAQELAMTMNQVERLRAGIRALSEHASLKAEEAIATAREIDSSRHFRETAADIAAAEQLEAHSLGEATAYAEMAERLEALLPTEIRA